MSIEPGDKQTRDAGALPRTVKVIYQGPKGETWLPGVATTETNGAVGGQLRMRRGIAAEVPAELAPGLLKRKEMIAADAKATS